MTCAFAVIRNLHIGHVRLLVWGKTAVLSIIYRLTSVVHIAGHIERSIYDECVIISVIPCCFAFLYKVAVADSKACIVLAVVGQALILIVVKFHILFH